MAGGSSDAAAVLFGVNKMFSLGLTTEQLMERGVKLGADVPLLHRERDSASGRNWGDSYASASDAAVPDPDRQTADQRFH